MAEIVQLIRSGAEKPAAKASGIEGLGQPAVAADPICGMTVAVAEARYTSTHDNTMFYFCCLGCKEKFEREPDRYLGQKVEG